MLELLNDAVEVDVEKLSPKLLREWLRHGGATGLMDYLWTTFLNGRPVAVDSLESAEDALRFLAIAKLVAEALDIAAGSDALDAWDWVEVPDTLIHPFVLGYLLANQGGTADLDAGLGGNLAVLVESYDSEVAQALASTLTETDFFIAIWSAHLGVEQFPPSYGDMEEHEFHLDECTADQGRLVDHIGNSWPVVPRTAAYTDVLLF